MSKNCNKIHLCYDANDGTTDEIDIYRIFYNSSDYQILCYEDGRKVTLSGTDSFIEIISKVLQTYEEGNYFDKLGFGFSIKEISYLEVPAAIKNNG